MSSIAEQSTALSIRDEPVSTGGSIAAFSSPSNYEAAKRMATALAQSDIVPAAYSNKVANCLVALELSARTGASVMMVMQNLHVIKGRPSWSGAFLIASVNSCGRFSPIRYEFEGTPSTKGWRCRAVARDLASRDLLEGEWITWEMVLGEGWLGKDGSKWKTMPGQMIRYRAASFWVRTYAPEISMGMHTAEEVEDIQEIRSERSATPATRDLNAALSGRPKVDEVVVDAEVEDPPTTAALDGRTCSKCGGVDGVHKPDCEFYSD